MPRRSIINKYLLLGVVLIATFAGTIGISFWLTSRIGGYVLRVDIAGRLRTDLLDLALLVERAAREKGPARLELVDELINERLPGVGRRLRLLKEGDRQQDLPGLDTRGHDHLISHLETLNIAWQKEIEPRFVQAVNGLRDGRESGPLALNRVVTGFMGEIDALIGWMVADYREELAGYNLWRFCFLGGVVLLLVMGVFLVRNRLVRPIRQLARAAEKVAGGDVHCRVEVSGRDELGRLGENFNRMTTVISQALADNALMIGNLKSLNQASNLVLSSLQPEELLQEFVEEACSLVKARYAIVFIPDESGGYEYFVTTGFGHDEFEAMKEQLGIPGGHGVLGLSLQGDKPVRIHDITGHADFAGFPPGHPQMTSFLGVPIRIEDRTIGAICIADTAAGRSFSVQDEETIVSLANAAALAIKKARLLQAALSANEELDVLNRIAAATRRTLRPEELMGYILDELLQLSAFRLLKKGAIFLVDQEARVLTLAVERNFNKELLGLCRRVEFGRCLCGIAAAENKVVESSRCLDDGRHVITFAGIEEHGHIVLPLAAADRVLGVLCLYLPPHTELTGRERDLFRSIADIIGMALQNALSFQEIEHTVQERAVELEKAAIELNKLFNAVEQAVETVMITDPDGVIEYVNPAFTSNCGYSREEVLGRNPRILASGKNPDGMFREMWQTIRAGRIWRGTVINRKKSGELCKEEMTVTPVKNETGEIVNFIAIKNDVTDRVRAEEVMRVRNIELTAAKEAAEAADRAKSEFLANMSHELRTPLNAIIGFSEMMGRGVAGELNPQQQEYLGDINASGRHLLELINSILDLSKIEAGRIDLEYDDVEVRQLVEESLLFVRQKAMEHGLEIAVEIDDQVRTVEADRFRLKQLLVNLLSNAVRFTPDRGRIVVRARIVAECPGGPAEEPCLPAEMLEIRVEDTGPGIRPGDMDRLFSPFTQLESSLTKVHRGTGLGLAICKRIAGAHGGSIWAESELGRGSNFMVRIPKYRQATSDRELARRLSRDSVVDPGTGIPTWKSFLASCRASIYHCRTDRSFGIVRLQCHSRERPDDHLAVSKILVRQMGEDEILTHGEQPGCYYVVLLASDRKRVRAAKKRFFRIAGDRGWECVAQSVVYPEDGETVGCLLEMLDKR